MATTGNASFSTSWAQARAILIRRRWWLLLPCFLGWIAVSSLRWVLPPQYRSQALLLVEQQSVPQTYVQPNVVFHSSELLQTMSQQVLSRNRLSRVVRRYGLYPATVRQQGLNAAVRRLRKAIRIQPVELAGLPKPRRGHWSAFRIAYRAATPALAQRVANRVTTMFIQANLRATQQASDRTTEFLRSQLQQASQTLAQRLQQLQNFERSHLGFLPGQDQANLTMVVSLQNEWAQSQSALYRTQQRIALDRSLLAQAPRTPAVRLRQQLAQLQARLRQLRSQYTDRYPDVVHVRNEIAAIQAQLARPGAGTPVAVPSLARVQLRSQLQAAEAMLPRQQAQAARLRRELRRYQNRLTLSPLPAAQLAALTASYNQAQSGYQALLAKLNSSQMATQLEQRQGGAQFRLINPPGLPRRPVWPKARVLSLLGLALGLILGIAASALAELSRDVIETEAELIAMKVGPVLTRVPPLHSPSQVMRHRMFSALQWTLASGLIGLIVAGNLLLWRS